MQEFHQYGENVYGTSARRVDIPDHASGMVGTMAIIGSSLIPFERALVWGYDSAKFGVGAYRGWQATRAARAIKPIATPYGAAAQSASAAALAARAEVQEGATLYRIGTMGKSQASEAQFWALESPLSPGYASRYGIPAENVANANFIETATLTPGTSFVTRPAPGVGANLGGGIEVVVPPNGVTMKSFSGW